MCRTGVQKQLSTASSALFARAIRASAAISNASVGGFAGLARNKRRVFGLIAAFHTEASVPSAYVVSIPNLERTVLNNCTVAPKTPEEHTTWSPAFSVAIAVARMADIPEAVATQACAPSRAESRSWNAVTVGLVKRE